MVPEGWRLSLLDSVTRRGSGHTPNKSEAGYWDGGIKWVSLADSSRLDKGRIHETDKEISEQGIQNSSAVLHPAGTVILSRDAGVGKSAILAEPMAVSQHFIAWRCDGELELHNWFLYYWLQWKKEYFERMAVGSTIKTIGLPLFKKLEVAHPCYTEQKKIAGILSTWDQAIETTEKLLANAEKQKRALMEQLLTGKRRLAGFERSWKHYRLGEISSVKIGGTPSRANPNYWNGGTLPWLAISDLGPKYIETTAEKITELGASKSNVKLIPSGVVVMSFKLTIGKVGITAREIYTNEAICAFFPTAEKKFTAEYLYQLLQISDLMVDVDQAVKGKTLNKAKIQDLRVALPDLAEQKAISEILLISDREIRLIQAENLNLKAQRNALMQQLLTGKRRVSV